MYIREYGKEHERTLLFFPGSCEPWQEFAYAAEALAGRFHVLLVVPDGHKYGDGYDVKDVLAAIREWMNVADALALLAHFFAWSSSLIHNTPDSFRLLAETKTPEERRLLKRLLKKWKKVLKRRKLMKK